MTVSSEVKTSRPRPLSPHLSVYRWQISNTLSILHRMTGVGLSAGAVVMVLWLWGAAYAPALHDAISAPGGYARSWWGQILLFGWTWAFFYHMAAGIRHLFWDIGMGFELPDMFASGMAVVISSILLTAFTWYLVLFY